MNCTGRHLTFCWRLLIRKKEKKMTPSQCTVKLIKHQNVFILEDVYQTWTKQCLLLKDLFQARVKGRPSKEQKNAYFNTRSIFIYLKSILIKKNLHTKRFDLLCYEWGSAPSSKNSSKVCLSHIQNGNPLWYFKRLLFDKKCLAVAIQRVILLPMIYAPVYPSWVLVSVQ